MAEWAQEASDIAPYDPKIGQGPIAMEKRAAARIRQGKAWSAT